MGFWDSRTLVPSITSWNVDWRKWVKDADELGIKSLAIFLTGIDKSERPELYKLLDESNVENIPFVHLKSDMDLWELDYFVEKWGTKAFNIHTEEEYRQENDISKYKNIIYVENVHLKLDEEEVKRWGGLCIDVNHIEEAKYIYKDIHEHNLGVMKKYKVGCNHLSPLKADIATDLEFKNTHLVENLSEFDYLDNYESRFFGPIMALEVRNPLKEQLPMLKYVVELLDGKEK